MTDFYIPKNCTLTVFGQTHRFVRGIHPVPDLIANSHEANGAGIKPVEEMTDDEYRLLGMPAPERKPDVVESAPVKADKAK